MADIHNTMHGPIPYARQGIEVLHWNEGTTMPLVIPVTMLCNTSDDLRMDNIRANSAKPIDWFIAGEECLQTAVIVGSGPSARHDIEAIKDLAADGAFIITVNGSTKWLNSEGLIPDAQFMIDARIGNKELIGKAKHYYLASQVHPEVVDAVTGDKTLVHLVWDRLEECLPRPRPAYTEIGSASSVGPVACFLAYALGHRTIELFGFDSCHESRERSHVAPQRINESEPCSWVKFGGKEYLCSLVMKQQAEQFPDVKLALEGMGATILVNGTGLLPDILNVAQKEMDEVEKYRAMWDNPQYRTVSPGANVAGRIAAWLPSKASVLDIGCGTGRASVYLAEAGFNPTLMDFADNCRDEDALSFPFILHDISQPFHVSWRYAICCDVMEHIPPEQVSIVLDNIATACAEVFFRIEFEPDYFGPATLGRPLHLSVHDHVWWTEELSRHWPEVDYQGDGVFIVRRP